MSETVSYGSYSEKSLLTRSLGLFFTLEGNISGSGSARALTEHGSPTLPTRGTSLDLGSNHQEILSTPAFGTDLCCHLTSATCAPIRLLLCTSPALTRQIYLTPTWFQMADNRAARNLVPCHLESLHSKVAFIDILIHQNNKQSTMIRKLTEA